MPAGYTAPHVCSGMPWSPASSSSLAQIPELRPTSWACWLCWDNDLCRDLAMECYLLIVCRFGAKHKDLTCCAFSVSLGHSHDCGPCVSSS